MVGAGSLLVASVGTLALTVVVHLWLDSYPPRLPRTEDPNRELLEAALLVAVNLGLAVYAALAIRGLAPRPSLLELQGRTINPAVVLVGLILAVALPLALEVRNHDRSLSSLGLRLPRAPLSTTLLVGAGIGQGLSALGSEPVAPAVLAFGLYNPAFEEEFLVHGVVQTKLERATTPTRAWLASGLVFGLLHVPNDLVGVFSAATAGDPAVAALLVARQTAFGLFAGVVFAKSRSLLAPVGAHYAVNALGPLVATVA